MHHQAEGIMRAVNLLITASIFSSLFISIVLMSAVVTGVVHSHVAALSPVAMN
jgi:hypothetical protein